MTTNEQLVGIFLRPQDGVTVDENNWKQVVTYLKTSCDICVENFILCADNITYAFLIPQNQERAALQIEEVIIKQIDNNTVNKISYEVVVWPINQTDLNDYFPAAEEDDDKEFENDDIDGSGEQKIIQVTGDQLSAIQSRRIKSFFESPQNGGGPTTDITKLTDTSVLISFNSAKVAEKFVQKAKVTINKIDLDISWPNEVAENDCSNKTIEVTVLSEDTIDDSELSDILAPLAAKGIEKVTKINSNSMLVTFTSDKDAQKLKQMVKYEYEDITLNFATYTKKGKPQELAAPANIKLTTQQRTSETSSPPKSFPQNALSQNPKAKKPEHHSADINKNIASNTAINNKKQADIAPTKSLTASNVPNKQQEENVEQQKSILVNGLTKEMNKEYLELFFESDQESSGGDLDNTWPVEIDEANGRAIITFEDHNVAKRVVAQKKIQVDEMNATLWVSWAPKRNVVEVICKNSSKFDLDDIKNILEQDSFGALNVTSMVQDPSSGKLFAIFDSEADARNLSQLQTIKWEDIELSINLCSFGRSQCDGLDVDSESETDEDVIEKCKEESKKVGKVVLLTGLSKENLAHKLKLYFGNKAKSGGGPLKEMEIEGNKAFLHYMDTETAQRVVAKGSHVLDGVTLTAQWPELFTVVEIIGTTSDMNPAQLKALLQSKTCDRAKVKEVLNADGKVYAEMETEEEANKLTKKSKILYKGKELIFILAKFFQASSIKATQRTKEKPAVPSKPNRFSKSSDYMDQIYLLQVSGFPEDAKYWDVKMYLSSKDYSGGGEIQRLDFDENERCAIVTYKTVTDAKEVLSKTPLLYKERYKLTVKPLLSILDANGKPATSHSLRVTGLENADEEMLKNTFENRSYSGGERDTVEEIIVAPDSKSAIIIYKTADTAERVAQKKTAKYEGKQVPVTYLKSQPLSRIEGDTELNKIIVHSFSDACPPEQLKKFLERKSNSQVKDIQYSLVPSVALVTFDGIPDYNALELLCVQKACYDQMIGIRKVLKPDTIQVHGTSDTDEYTLKLHFELDNVSGGGKVLSFSYPEEEENCCLMKFANSEVVNKISSIPTQVFGQGKRATELHVRAYYADLKIIPPGHDTSKPVKSIPHSTQINISKVDIIIFVSKVKQLRSSIDEQLAQKKAKLDWSAIDGTKVLVLCDLKYNLPNIRILAETWVADITDVVKTFFSRLECKTLVVFEKLWEEFISKSSYIIEESAKKADTIAIELDKRLYSIKLVGLIDEVIAVFEKLNNILAHIQGKNEMVSKYMTEDISNLKPFQYDLFLMLKIGDNLQQSLNVNVKVDQQNRTLQLEGVPEKIQEAKLKILESLQTNSRSLDILPEFKLLMERDEESIAELRTSLIDRECGNLPLEAVWELGENCIILHATNEATAKYGISILADNFKERLLNLDEACRKFALRDNWQNLTSNVSRKITLCDTKSVLLKYSNKFNSLIITGSGLNSTVLVKFDENMKFIKFYGNKTPAESAKELVSEYLKERAIYEDFIRLTWISSKYVNLRYSSELKEIEQQHAYDNVSIRVHTDRKKPGLALRGRKMKLDTLVNKLRAYDNTACKKKYAETNKDRYDFYQSNEGTNFLHTLEEKYKVAVLSNTKSILEYKKQQTQLTDKICEVNLVNKPESGPKQILGIIVLLENIVFLPVDAIVNSANENLQLLGGVAGAILKHGGQIIQTECEEYVKTNGQLQVSQVFTSSAGNLLCKNVIHAVGPQWKDGNQNEENDLYDTIYNLLLEASRRNLKSIALTPIGAGMYGFPIQTSLHNIIDSIHDFFKSEQATSLQQIFLTSIQTEEVREIIKQLKITFEDKVDVLRAELDDKMASEGTFIHDNGDNRNPKHRQMEEESTDGDMSITDATEEDKNAFVIFAENEDVADKVIAELQSKP